MYFQCDPSTRVEDWSDDRIWDRLQRIVAGPDGFTLKTGPIIDKTVLGFRSYVRTPLSHRNVFLAGDADGDGRAEVQETFLGGLNQPFGMALVGDTFYVGNTDGVMASPYTPGATQITAPGRRLSTYKTRGHWTRSLLPSRDTI